MNRILLIFSILISTTCLVACSDKKQPPPPPTPVKLDTVHLQHAVYYDMYPGNVVALSQVELHAQVEGYITAIYFKEGDHVRKGQKLYEIDQSKYIASVNQANANVRVAQSNLEQSKKDADRYIYLNQHDAVAKQILDHAITTLQNSKDQVTAAKQDLVKAQTDLRFSVITAPFDGTIGISQVKLGTLVSPGQTILNTISTDNPMAVDFVVNEKQVGRFIDLQNNKVKKVDSLFTILKPDGMLYGHNGDISVIDRGVDPQSGTIKIRLVFPNPDFELRAGMSCKVRIHNNDTGKQMIVPGKAVIEQMGEYFIYVAKDTVVADQDSAQMKKSAKAKEEGKDDDAAKNTKDEKQNAGAQPSLRAYQKKVLLGQTIDSNVIVKQGLVEGEVIITEGTQKLHDGSKVNGGKPTGNEAQPGNGAANKKQTN